MRQLFTLLALLLVGCSAKVPVPPFDVQVVLTAAAQKELEASGETISVSIFFDGDGAPRPGENTAPFRAVYLGDHEFELRRPGRVRISDARLSEEALSRLSDPNYHFTINMASGRRVFRNNVLASDAVCGRVSDLSTNNAVLVTGGLLEPATPSAPRPPSR